MFSKPNNSRQFHTSEKTEPSGGGAAIIYNENRFSFEELNVPTSSEIESVWALCTPHHKDHNVKRIAIGSYYVSPRARNKQDIIDNIIDTIHTLKRVSTSFTSLSSNVRSDTLLLPLYVIFLKSASTQHGSCSGSRELVLREHNLGSPEHNLGSPGTQSRFSHI